MTEQIIVQFVFALERGQFAFPPRDPAAPYIKQSAGAGSFIRLESYPDHTTTSINKLNSDSFLFHLVVRVYVKSVGMAHFNLASHTASGALANSGIRHGPGEISVPPAIQSELPAKQRRLSRSNTIEEIRRKRRKRNKKEREKKKRLSRQEKRDKMAKKIDKTFVNQEKKLKHLKIRAGKERNRAIDFWRKWDKEKMLRTTSNL